MGQRPEEVVGRHEEGVLPVIEDVAQVGVAIGEVVAVDIALVAHAEEIVEVDLVAVVVLLVVEIELVGHLVGEEACLLAGFFVVHGTQCGESAEAQHEGGQDLFHIAYMFRGETSVLF